MKPQVGRKKHLKSVARSEKNAAIAPVGEFSLKNFAEQYAKGDCSTAGSRV
jgi:hypothetical protein